MKSDGEGFGQVASSGRWVRLAWVAAVVGFSVPALFRIASTQSETIDFLASIVVAIVLTLTIGVGIIWLLTLSAARRGHFLRRAFPESTIFHVAELGNAMTELLPCDPQSPAKHSYSHSVTVVISQSYIEFWTGGGRPSRFARVSRKQLKQVDGFTAFTGLRRARGVRLFTTSGGQIDFVPIERMGQPLRSASVNSIIEELRTWSDA